MMTLSDPDDKLIEEGLQRFSNELHTALPLRHFGEFHDQSRDQLMEVIQQRRDIVYVEVINKLWPRDKEEIFTIIMKLNERMKKEVIAEWVMKNSEHRVQSVSFLQKSVEMICDDFDVALESQLALNPDMDLDSLKSYVGSRNSFATSWFERMWKPGNSQIVEDRKKKLEKHLKTVAEEVLEKQKLHFETKAGEEGRKLMEERKDIVVEMSRQLKSYVADDDDHRGPVSKRRLNGIMEEIREYLMSGKGVALRGSDEETYSKLIEILEQEAKFLDGYVEANEELRGWAEGFHVKIKSCCFGNEGETDKTGGVQQESNGSHNNPNEQQKVTVQEILNKFKEELWDPCGPEEQDNRTDQGNKIGNSGRNAEDDILSSSNTDSGGAEALAVTVPAAKKRSLGLISTLKVEDSYDRPTKSVTANEISMPKKRKTGNGSSKNIEGRANIPPRRRSSRLNKTMAKAKTGNKSSRRNVCHSKTVAHGAEQMNKSSSKEESNVSNVNVEDHLMASPGMDDENVERKIPRIKNRDQDLSEKISILTGKPLIFQCNVCQMKGRGKKYFLTHHGEFCSGDQTRKRFVCKECDKGFTRKLTLQEHARSHAGEKPFKCPNCAIQFAYQKTFRNHVRRHSREACFGCKVCNVSFISPHALYQHNLTHLGKLPFACCYCDKRFERMCKLKYHVVLHSDECPFKCPTCDVSFALKQALSSHIWHVHKQPRQISNKLADEAAVAYLSRETKNKSFSTVPVNKIHSLVVSHVIKKAKLQLPDKSQIAKLRLRCVERIVI